MRHARSLLTFLLLTFLACLKPEDSCRATSCGIWGRRPQAGRGAAEITLPSWSRVT
jgi:hypothetical protein